MPPTLLKAAKVLLFSVLSLAVTIFWLYGFVFSVRNILLALSSQPSAHIAMLTRGIVDLVLLIAWVGGGIGTAHMLGIRPKPATL